MKLRLKFGSSFKIVDVEDEALLSALIRETSTSFHITENNVLVSLNSSKFYSLDDGRLKLHEIGFVPGDIIYVKSLLQSDDIRTTHADEAFDKIAESMRKIKLPSNDPGVRVALAPLDVSASAKHLVVNYFKREFASIPQSHSVVESSPTLVRVRYKYTHVGADGKTTKIPITFTIMRCGNFLSFATTVIDRNLRIQMAVKFDRYFVDPQTLDADSRKNVRVIYKNPREMLVQLTDELIEPTLIAVHEEFSLPPRFNVTRLPYIVLVKIFNKLPLADLSCLSRSCRDFNRLITTSEAFWRPRLKRALRMKPCEDVSEYVLQNSSTSSSDCPSLAAYKNYVQNRRFLSRPGVI